MKIGELIDALSKFDPLTDTNIKEINFEKKHEIECVKSGYVATIKPDIWLNICTNKHENRSDAIEMRSFPDQVWLE